MEIPHFLYPVLVDIWVVSTFWLLQTVLLRTFMSEFLCGHVSTSLLGCILEVGVLAHVSTLCLTIWGVARLFAEVAALFYIPPRQCMKVAICPHPCRPLLLSRFFNYSHPSGCEVVSHYGFALHFPDRWWCWTTFYVLMGHLYNFFGEFLIHHISHLLKFPLSWGKVWYCNKTLYLWLCLHSYHTQSLANHGNISQWLLVLSKYFIYLFIYVFIFCTQSFLSFIFLGMEIHLNTHAC